MLGWLLLRLLALLDEGGRLLGWPVGERGDTAAVWGLCLRVAPAVPGRGLAVVEGAGGCGNDPCCCCCCAPAILLRAPVTLERSSPLGWDGEGGVMGRVRGEAVEGRGGRVEAADAGDPGRAANARKVVEYKCRYGISSDDTHAGLLELIQMAGFTT